MSLSKLHWLYLYYALASFGLLVLSCQTTPKPCPDAATVAAEVRLQKRAIEMIPFVVTGADIQAKNLAGLRASFAQHLVDSGVFALVTAEEQADFVLSGTVTQLGKIALKDAMGLATSSHNGSSLRAVFELKSKRDNHLVAVAGAIWQDQGLVQQHMSVENADSGVDGRVYMAMLQVLRQSAAQLALRFGPGARYKDPALLDDDSLQKMARKKYLQGAYFEAEALLRNLCGRKPHHARYPSWLGDIYLSRHDDARAIEMYNAAIDLEPKRFHDLIFLGQAALRLGDHKRARKVWKQALRLEPKGAISRVLRSRLRKLGVAGESRRKGRGLQNATSRDAAEAAQLSGDEF